MSSYIYQIVELGYKNEYEIDLIKETTNVLSDLNIPVDSIDFIDESNFSAKYKRNQACFGIYYANESGNSRSLDEIEILIKAGVPILPVFKNSFDAEVPNVLENQNGLGFNPQLKPKIVNLILESFGMLRSARKIFISYKRSESTSVAIQLYEALERSNFDCFLDTHSIKQGEPFQDELWHRMTDCDVIVLLNTKRFLESHWCKEEIAMAGIKKIGIVQLIWPDNKLAATDEVCFPSRLNAKDFKFCRFKSKKAKLKKSVLKRIIHDVESLRARNLASRREGLITEFINSAKIAGRTMEVQPQRFITETLPNNKRKLFIPSIGIPQSLDCQQSEEISKEILEYEIERLYLIYDDLRIRDRWVNHLDWLNDKLDVKTIKKQEFDTWLKK